MLTNPWSASSSFDDAMPSLPAVSAKEPSLTLTQSLPTKASPTALTVYVPPVITRSSFDLMPSLHEPVAESDPVPCSVRSAVLYSAASRASPSLSVTADDESASAFWVPAASVTNTLSALST